MNVLLAAVLSAVFVGLGDPVVPVGKGTRWSRVQQYAECLRKAGFVPVLVPQTADTNELAHVFSRLDALVLTGGEDVDPRRYGAAPSPKLGEVVDARDAFEYALLDAAMARHLPIFGVCRGVQIINVYFGGTLWQDLPSEYRGSEVAHCRLDRPCDGVHDIIVEEESRLASVIGVGKVSVNSMHHQAVRDIAPGFRISARATDGVIEAIESEHDPVVGVQFHPEELSNGGGHALFQRMFSEFFVLTGAHRTSRPEVTWSIMHPVAIDVAYMRRVAAKAVEYNGVDSFEVCGLEQKGVNALSLFERYPHAHANADQAFVEKTRADLNAVCDIAHGIGKRIYFWHRENLVPKGLLEDAPELLNADGEFDLSGEAYHDYLRYKIDETFRHCPQLDGLVLTLTESEYSVLHNSNPARYPPERIVREIAELFTSELAKRGKRFVLRSFGDAEDYERIIGGGVASAKKNGICFEIETKVTTSDFVPWLPNNRFLRKSQPLTLGAECDAFGEFLGAGYLPAVQVGRIREYVDFCRGKGVDRYAIRIDRRGFSIFDSAQEVNLYAYMRFVADPSLTEDAVLKEFATKRFGGAAAEMIPDMKDELEMVRDICYVASNLTFHAFPVLPDFKYVKAGGIHALYRENADLSMAGRIWSIFAEMKTPSHVRIRAEKDEGVRRAERGLATLERMRDRMPADEYARQHRAFANAVRVAKAMRAHAACTLAYFEDMAAQVDEPSRLVAAADAADREIVALRGTEIDGFYLDGIQFLCRELVREYRIERAMRRELERPDVYDFVIPGGLYDDVRLSRAMHAAYPETKADCVIRYAGNLRYPDGTITVKLTAPADAEIEVRLDPDGTRKCMMRKSWSDGVWTVVVGKDGAEHPGILSIAALAHLTSVRATDRTADER